MGDVGDEHSEDSSETDMMFVVASGERTRYVDTSNAVVQEANGCVNLTRE